MMNLLGFKRLVIIGALLLLNVVLIPSLYLYFLPQNARLQSQLQDLTAQATQKATEAQNLREQFATIQQQKVLFENIQAAGFLTDQSRAVARRRIEEIQQFTHVLRAGYEVSAATIEKYDEATAAGYMVLDSPLTINVDALDDVDIYNFIYWIEMTMPGHIALEDLKMERNYTVNEGTLRNIGNGIPTVMVKGTMKVAWRTMVPMPKSDTMPPGTEAVQ